MKLFGIIGNPVEHSLSPVMQNEAFKYLNIDACYLKFKVEEAKLRYAILGAESLGFSGLNVTVPHKEKALKYVEPDELAGEVGAVNTIYFKKGVKGFNTDAMGAKMALEGVTDIKGKRILIFGAGGAAKAISYGLSRYSDTDILIANRTFSEGLKLANKIGGEAIRLGDIFREIKSVDILINATTVGLNEDRSLIYSKNLHKDMVVFDIVYSPLKTCLLKEAEKAGAKTIDGLKMLVYQGAASFEIWTGVKAPVKVMERAVRHAVERG
ncbi:MAG: Shikimate dehydrogenase [Candidatus Methanolliviera sp. GoM_oil]|nr:MAG: Shikimate dehydrogenase [Candidatus Methanolliviera sp. GoM_oil]